MNTVDPPVGERAARSTPRVLVITERELDAPSVKTVLKLIYNTVVRVLHDPVGILIGSAFFVLMLWGPHGNFELFRVVHPGWTGPGSPVIGRQRLIPSVPWDQEWISFAAGLIFVVAVPVLLIRFVFRQNLRDFGLGLPRADRWPLTIIASVLLLGLSLPAFYIGAQNPAMQATYPLYRGVFAGTGEFVTYQLGYLAFFIAIEFIFRGYLLFGLYQVKDRATTLVQGERGPLVFGYYAIFISMLSYTAWHLGKPMPELWGTLVWGVAAGTIALFIGSIWPIILVHWLLNVFLDLVIWKQL